MHRIALSTARAPVAAAAAAAYYGSRPREAACAMPVTKHPDISRRWPLYPPLRLRQPRVTTGSPW